MMRLVVKVAVPMALTLGLTSCQAASTLPQASRVPAITGQVTDLLAARTTQASINEVANGATVSLIDTTTGQTVATTVTAASGAFSLSFGRGFNPGLQPYYMEAVKGLPVGGIGNRAGASLARLRTILYFNGGWTSLNSPVPNAPLYIGPASTALCDIVSLRNLSASNLVGSLNGTTFNPPGGSAITQTEFNTVLALVGPLLSADEDPVEAVAYDSSASVPYFAKPGNLVIYDNVNPTVVSAGGTATFYGQNFPSTASVLVGQLPVATWSVNAARTQLAVTLPGNGYGGLLQISQGSSTWTGPFLGVHGTVGTLAGSGNRAYLDGKGFAASFYSPSASTVDAAGNLYVADSYNGVVRKVSPTGVVTTLADATGAAINFSDPVGVAVDSALNVYVAARGSNQVFRVTASGAVSVFAGSGTPGVANGTTATAQFNGPFGVAVDATGNVYVSDENGADLRKISGGNVTTLAGSPSVSNFADGTGNAAMFNWPTGLALDAAGNVYVADYNNGRIRKVTPGGSVTSILTAGNPVGVSVDGAGDVFCVSSTSHQLRELPFGGSALTLAGSGTQGFLDGLAASAQLNTPYAVSAAPNGNVLMTEWGGERIRVYTP